MKEWGPRAPSGFHRTQTRELALRETMPISTHLIPPPPPSSLLPLIKKKTKTHTLEPCPCNGNCSPPPFIERKLLLTSLAQAVSSGASRWLRRSRVGSVPGAGGGGCWLPAVGFIHSFRAEGQEPLHAGSSRCLCTREGYTHPASSRASRCQPPPRVTGGRWEEEAAVFWLLSCVNEP